jgi:hypothetical protein
MQSFAHFEASLHHGIIRTPGDDLFEPTPLSGSPKDNAIGNRLQRVSF